MHSLFDYEILVNDVFYRGYNILIWIEKHPNMTILDKEAISNTIMDALVYKELIDKETERLDLENLRIVKSRDDKYFKYQSSPNVAGIPLWMMEKYEDRFCKFSGNSSAAFFLSKSGEHYCIYDMNNVLSIIFSDFYFIMTSYDSPTRNGIRVEKRPFIEVELYGEPYLIDCLTKRIYKKMYFVKNYKMKEIERRSNKNFSYKEKQSYKNYSKQITDERIIGLALSYLPSLFNNEVMKNAEMSECSYYYKKMLEKYPTLLEQTEKKINKFFGGKK